MNNRGIRMSISNVTYQNKGVYYVVCLQIIRGNFRGEQSRQEWLMVDERTPAATTCISDCSFGSILFRLYVLFLMVTCSCKNLK